MEYINVYSNLIQLKYGEYNQSVIVVLFAIGILLFRCCVFYYNDTRDFNVPGTIAIETLAIQILIPHDSCMVLLIFASSYIIIRFYIELCTGSRVTLTSIRDSALYYLIVLGHTISIPWPTQHDGPMYHLIRLFETLIFLISAAILASV